MIVTVGTTNNNLCPLVLTLLLALGFLLPLSESFPWASSRHDRCHHPSSWLLSAATSSADDTPSPQYAAIRLNKVFKATHSRRQADVLIASGRVTVNGQPTTGAMVQPFVDRVALDGVLIEGWEALNGIVKDDEDVESTGDSTSASSTAMPFEYIKYWKPRGVTCTTDRRIPGNILDALEQNNNNNAAYQPRHRVFPVGRLDKDTSGLILVTSDGRLPNALLRAQHKRCKVYHVWVDQDLTDQDIEQLRTGIVITTVAQRDRTAKPLTAPTQPCHVERNPRNARAVRMTLTEGRNRQIRKMMAALGKTVVRLHRVSFGGIGLPPLEGPGDWEYLNEDELKLILNSVESQQVME